MELKISERVKAFYNNTPFPDFELSRFKTKEALKINAQPFAKLLNRSIPAGSSILDVGTGTGQMSAYLSLKHTNTWGIDFSDASLNKAIALKEQLKLDNLTLRKINILDKNDIASIDHKFDYIISLGVLHHTADPYQSFKNILTLLKDDGYIAIGLYNTSGRIQLKLRKLLISTIFRNNQKIKNWFLKMQLDDLSDAERTRGWWHDQYLHPHETTHSIGEVLRWFKKNDIEYYQTIPYVTPLCKKDLDISGLWNKNDESYPNIFIRLYQQFKWVFTTHHEGGYFITFGKKK